MSYTIQYWAAVVVAVALGGLTFLQAGDAESFGISPVVVKWLGVVSAMLGVLAGALPSWRRPPNDARAGLD